MKLDLNTVVALIMDISAKLVAFGFVVLMAASVLKYFGFNVPVARPPAAQEFAYIAGAWWLLRKA